MSSPQYQRPASRAQIEGTPKPQRQMTMADAQRPRPKKAKKPKRPMRAEDYPTGLGGSGLGVDDSPPNPLAVAAGALFIGWFVARHHHPGRLGDTSALRGYSQNPYNY